MTDLSIHSSISVFLFLMKVLVEDINIVLKSIKLSHSIQMSVCDADLEPLPPLQLFFYQSWKVRREEGGGRRRTIILSLERSSIF